MQGFDWVKPCRGGNKKTLHFLLLVNQIHVDEIKPGTFTFTWQKGQ